MTSIYRYRPVITEGPNGTDFRPRAESPEHALTDLAVLDGRRYVAVTDGATVDVPAEIETWEQIALTDDLREELKAVSQHCQFARDEFVRTLRARYSIDDELYFARIATGALLGSYTMQQGEAEQIQAYQQYVEAAREALHERYSALGLAS